MGHLKDFTFPTAAKCEKTKQNKNKKTKTFKPR